MRHFLQTLLNKPIARLADKISSRPDKKRVDKALSGLYENIETRPGEKGLVLPFDAHKDKFIILSDQHKGARDGADIFAFAEKNYLAVLTTSESGLKSIRPIKKQTTPLARVHPKQVSFLCRQYGWDR